MFQNVQRDYRGFTASECRLLSVRGCGEERGYPLAVTRGGGKCQLFTTLMAPLLLSSSCDKRAGKGRAGKGRADEK